MCNTLVNQTMKQMKTVLMEKFLRMKIKIKNVNCVTGLHVDMFYTQLYSNYSRLQEYTYILSVCESITIDVAINICFF